MKLFGIQLNWSKATIAELQEAIAFMVTKKSITELEQEQEILMARLDFASGVIARTESNRQIVGPTLREMRVQNGAITAALQRKKNV